MKKQSRNRLPSAVFFIVLLSAGTIALFGTLGFLRLIVPTRTQSHLSELISTPIPTIRPVPSPTPPPAGGPTPLPYPPAGYHCVSVPILMYHHVEPLAEAKTAGHAQLTVDSDIFAHQMQYLADHGYTVTDLRTLSDYFDGHASLPKKPVILTFDDGYDDFYTYAVPVLESHGFRSELFVPTGLLENPGYLSWDQVHSASTRGVWIDHHTWSHANIARSGDEFFRQELDQPTQQLTEHGYGPVTVFAYPYGTHNGHDVVELIKRGFTIAVTTLPGTKQCKEDRFALHRTRVGNSSLASYGL